MKKNNLVLSDRDFWRAEFVRLNMVRTRKDRHLDRDADIFKLKLAGERTYEICKLSGISFTFVNDIYRRFLRYEKHYSHLNIDKARYLIRVLSEEQIDKVSP